MEISTKRTARRINVNDDFLNNTNVNLKIGAAENRKGPETIYIEISFWLKPKDNKEDSKVLRKRFIKNIRDVYRDDLNDLLSNNKFFPKKEENMFILDVPENINYNDKKNFVSVELYLHTINSISSKKFPLDKKDSTELYEEALKVSQVICNSDLFKNQKDFLISKRKG